MKVRQIWDEILVHDQSSWTTPISFPSVFLPLSRFYLIDVGQLIYHFLCSHQKNIVYLHVTIENCC